jgi:hypothetical protein
VKLTDKAETMTGRYEHMRAMRLMHRQRTQEMELMIGSGMYGWMEAWAQYGSIGAQAHQQDSCCDTYPPTAPSPISGAARGEAVGILSAMVWDIVKEDAHVYGN